MSIQFGRWNYDGGPVTPDFMERVSALVAPYGPDDAGSYVANGVAILYRAFHTNKESRAELQPQLLPHGVILVWDGRLDNRKELIQAIGGNLTGGASDSAIVGSAYHRWGETCFSKLLGDWAVSVWSPKEATLLLAKDFSGIRPLFYVLDRARVTWSSNLEPLVVLSDGIIELEEEYIAGWFSHFPAPHLTPYEGIHAVPPGCCVTVKNGGAKVAQYWNFDPEGQIRYRTDEEYEEHFRNVFASSVRRRLRSDTPVVAELSGGVDSSSIVCVADEILAQGRVDAPCINTVSYFNGSEPNWNERPFFGKVEEKRGRAGFHIDVSTKHPFHIGSERHGFPTTPLSGGHPSEADKQFAAFMLSRGNRVLLSGIGGDEVLGGTPNPMPELQDLFAGARFRELAHRLKLWSLSERKPWFHLLFEVTRSFLPPTLSAAPTCNRPAAWLCPSFVNRHRAALTGYPTSVNLYGPRPSFQDNISTLGALQRQLGCHGKTSDPPYERCYPYLDRELLEFLYALPGEQLIRPNQRRSLMRRALAGIVPDEILNRKRKAFISRGPLAALSEEWPRVTDLTSNMVSASLGIVNPRAFCEALERARKGQEIHIVSMLRTLTFECWLRRLKFWSFPQALSSELRDKQLQVRAKTAQSEVRV